MEINIIPKFLDEALTPIAKESGERLADIVSLVFTPIIKAKAKRDKNIELFLKELDEEVKKIPENKIQEPPLHIVAPSLEAVFKYYCDEKYLQSMFVRLITSSMNSDSKIHPSFIETIKQLSQYDLAVLFFFFIVRNKKDGEMNNCGKTFFILYHKKVENNWRFARSFICWDYRKDENRWVNADKLLVSLFNLLKLSLIYIMNEDSEKVTDIDELKLDPNSRMYKENIEMYDYEDENREYVMVQFFGTTYLEKFMNVCYSEKLYDIIDVEMVFE